jgi:hypothetical protein
MACEKHRSPEAYVRWHCKCSFPFFVNDMRRRNAPRSHRSSGWPEDARSRSRASYEELEEVVDDEPTRGHPAPDDVVELAGMRSLSRRPPRRELEHDGGMSFIDRSSIGRPSASDEVTSVVGRPSLGRRFDRPDSVTTFAVRSSNPREYSIPRTEHEEAYAHYPFESSPDDEHEERVEAGRNERHTEMETLFFAPAARIHDEEYGPSSHQAKPVRHVADTPVEPVEAMMMRHRARMPLHAVSQPTPMPHEGVVPSSFPEPPHHVMAPASFEAMQAIHPHAIPPASFQAVPSPMQTMHHHFVPTPELAQMPVPMQVMSSPPIPIVPPDSSSVSPWSMPSDRSSLRAGSVPRARFGVTSPVALAVIAFLASVTLLVSALFMRAEDGRSKGTSATVAPPTVASPTTVPNTAVLPPPSAITPPVLAAPVTPVVSSVLAAPSAAPSAQAASPAAAAPLPAAPPAPPAPALAPKPIATPQASASPNIARPANTTSTTIAPRATAPKKTDPKNVEAILDQLGEEQLRR